MFRMFYLILIMLAFALTAAGCCDVMAELAEKGGASSSGDEEGDEEGGEGEDEDEEEGGEGDDEDEEEGDEEEGDEEEGDEEEGDEEEGDEEEGDEEEGDEEEGDEEEGDEEEGDEEEELGDDKPEKGAQLTGDPRKDMVGNWRGEAVEGRATPRARRLVKDRRLQINEEEFVVWGKTGRPRPRPYEVLGVEARTVTLKVRGTRGDVFVEVREDGTLAVTEGKITRVYRRAQRGDL